MSVPEANALSPAPVRIKALRAEFSFASWQISARRSYIWNVKALRACGRLKVIRPIPSRTSNRISFVCSLTTPPRPDRLPYRHRFTPDATDPARWILLCPGGPWKARQSFVRYERCRRPTLSVRYANLRPAEGDQRTPGWRSGDWRHIGGGDRRRPGATRDRVHHLARRQRRALPQVGVHQIHRLIEVAMQRNVLVVIAGELVERVQMLRIRHLVVAQRADRKS